MTRAIHIAKNRAIVILAATVVDFHVPVIRLIHLMLVQQQILMEMKFKKIQMMDVVVDIQHNENYGMYFDHW